MVYAIGGQAGLYFACDVEAEAFAAVVTELTELGFEPSSNNVVVGQGSALLRALFL